MRVGLPAASAAAASQIWSHGSLVAAYTEATPAMPFTSAARRDIAPARGTSCGLPASASTGICSRCDGARSVTAESLRAQSAHFTAS